MTKPKTADNNPKTKETTIAVGNLTISFERKKLSSAAPAVRVGNLPDTLPIGPNKRNYTKTRSRCSQNTLLMPLPTPCHNPPTPQQHYLHNTTTAHPMVQLSNGTDQPNTNYAKTRCPTNTPTTVIQTWTTQRSKNTTRSNTQSRLGLSTHAAAAANDLSVPANPSRPSVQTRLVGPSLKSESSRTDHTWTPSFLCLWIHIGNTKSHFHGLTHVATYYTDYTYCWAY